MVVPRQRDDAKIKQTKKIIFKVVTPKINDTYRSLSPKKGKNVKSLIVQASNFIDR